MARRKAEPKPLFAVKGDFTESLDAFVQASLLFHGMAKMALDLGYIDQRIEPKFREAFEKFDRAISRDDED